MIIFYISALKKGIFSHICDSCILCWFIYVFVLNIVFIFVKVLLFNIFTFLKAFCLVLGF